MARGRFITLEGIEGAGKSTAMTLLQQIIEAAHIPLLLTREPGGTPLGEELRELLLGHKHTGMSDDAELLMMFASRAEHLHARIQPALEMGSWVLCDRFTDATYAYQGGGRGLSPERIRILEQWVQQGLRPDLTILLDLPVEVGLERAGKRSEPDRFESEKIPFFQRVRQAYLDISMQQPDRVKVVDASQPLEQVSEQLRTVMKEFLDIAH